MISDSIPEAISVTAIAARITTNHLAEIVYEFTEPMDYHEGMVVLLDFGNIEVMNALMNFQRNKPTMESFKFKSLL